MVKHVSARAIDLERFVLCIRSKTNVDWNCSKDAPEPKHGKGRAGVLSTTFVGMREVAHFPHPLMRITVHSYNGQWRLRFELDRYEQSFKYPESDHTLAELQAKASVLSEGVLLRFVDMRAHYLEHLTES
jgi:hypothetical protein